MPAFKVEWIERGLAHLVMDDPDRKVNLLDEAAIADLDLALSELEKNAGLLGVVLRSGKAGSFKGMSATDFVCPAEEVPPIDLHMSEVARSHIIFESMDQGLGFR